MPASFRRTLLLLILGLPILLQSALMAAAAQNVRGDHGVKATSFRLANGLEVVLIPDHRAPVVTHSLWYKVGAADDPSHSHGLAHFLEHMMFKGTERFPNGRFDEVISRIGGIQNAITSDSYTAYYQIIPKTHLAQMMEMEADRMTNLVMRDEEVVTERTVILQERRASIDDQPLRRLMVKAGEALYGDHPLNTDLIGSPEEILAFSREDAMAFYRRHYMPANAVLVIAGDITETELRPLAEKSYGLIPARDVPADRPALKPLPPLAAKRVQLSDSHLVAPGLGILYRLPGIHDITGREAAALGILADILGSDTGRLRRELVLKGLVISVASSFTSGLAGQFLASANAASNINLEQVETVIMKVIGEVLSSGVTQAELEVERANHLAGDIYSMDSQSGLAGMYGRNLVLGLTIEQVAEWQSHIKAVTVEDVNAVARKYLREDVKVAAEAWPDATASIVPPATNAPSAAAQ
jgi:zinc protease